jgi:hypothetical protein
MRQSNLKQRRMITSIMMSLCRYVYMWYIILAILIKVITSLETYEPTKFGDPGI